jgi:hypothetical protein
MIESNKYNNGNRCDGDVKWLARSITAFTIKGANGPLRASPAIIDNAFIVALLPTIANHAPTKQRFGDLVEILVCSEVAEGRMLTKITLLH